MRFLSLYMPAMRSVVKRTAHGLYWIHNTFLHQLVGKRANTQILAAHFAHRYSQSWSQFPQGASGLDQTLDLSLSSDNICGEFWFWMPFLWLVIEEIFTWYFFVVLYGCGRISLIRLNSQCFFWIVWISLEPSWHFELCTWVTTNLWETDLRSRIRLDSSHTLTHTISNSVEVEGNFHLTGQYKKQQKVRSKVTGKEQSQNVVIQRAWPVLLQANACYPRNPPNQNNCLVETNQHQDPSEHFWSTCTV